MRTTKSSTSNGEGEQTLSAACADLSGNVGSASYSVKVDTTAPTISAAAGSNPNAAGWYNGDVTVVFSCADTLSGVASCPPSQILTGEGANISSTAQSVSDRAGNTSALSNIDEYATSTSGLQNLGDGYTSSTGRPRRAGAVCAAPCGSTAATGRFTPRSCSL